MAITSKFLLQYSNINYSEINGSSADTVIIESGVTYRGDLPAQVSNAPTLSSVELNALAATGKHVLAYVNVAVTDHLRDYWDDSWVTYLDGNERDSGIINPLTAPDFLINNYGGISLNVLNLGDDAYIVDYTDSAWQTLIIDEAVALVTNTANGGYGYGGVYLDHVSRYLEAGNAGLLGFDTTKTDAMLDFVTDIANAVKAANPDAYVAINGDPDIAGNATNGAAGAEFTAMLAAIDGVVIENGYANEVDANPNNNTLTSAKTVFASGAEVMALENEDSDIDTAAFEAFTRADADLIGYTAANADYSAFAEVPAYGTINDDIIVGGDGANVINALAGDDSINSGGGNDTINADSGSNLIYDGDGDDIINGGNGYDKIHGGAGADTIDGGDGDIDYLSYDESDAAVTVSLTTGAGTGGYAEGDTIVNIERLHGSQFDDTLSGDSNDNILRGYDGIDTIYSISGLNSIYDGDGDDFIYGGDGYDKIRNGEGADYIDGGDGEQDYVSYFESDASVTVSLATGTGTGGYAEGDTIINVERILGSLFDDTLYGDSGDNVLKGYAGADVMISEAGADKLHGMEGADTLTGGDDADIFIFSSLDDTTVANTDIITDFAVGEDMLDFTLIGLTDYNDFSFLYDGVADITTATYDNVNDFALNFSGDIEFTSGDLV